MTSADRTTVELDDVARQIMKHRTALYGYAFACLRNHDDAEEVLQEVSVTVLRCHMELSGRDEFLPWAREIARRRVLEYQRKNKRYTALDHQLADALAETAATMTPPNDERESALVECLEKLPDKRQQAIARRYDQPRQTVEEIAQWYGCSTSAMYGILKRARHLLRRCIEQRLQLENQA